MLDQNDTRSRDSENKKNEQLEVGKQSTKNNNLFQELLYHQGEPLKDKNN